MITNEFVLKSFRSRTIDRTLKILMSLPAQSTIGLDEELRPLLFQYFDILDQIEVKYRIKELAQDHSTVMLEMVDRSIEAAEEEESRILGIIVGVVRRSLKQ